MSNTVIEIKESQLKRIAFDKQLSIQDEEFERKLSELEEKYKEDYDTTLIQAREIGDTIFNKINFDQTLKTDTEDNRLATTIKAFQTIDILQMSGVRDWFMKKNPEVLNNYNTMPCIEYHFYVKIKALMPVYHYMNITNIQPAFNSTSFNVVINAINHYQSLVTECGIMNLKLSSVKLHPRSEINNIIIGADEWFFCSFIDVRSKMGLFRGYTLRDRALVEYAKLRIEDDNNELSKLMSEPTK